MTDLNPPPLPAPPATHQPETRPLSVLLKGLAFIAAIIGICTEAALIMTQYQEAVIAFETSKAAALNQHSLADLKTAEADIEAQAAAVADRQKSAEADLAKQKALTAKAEADVAQRLKTAEAARKLFDARAEQAKAKFALQNPNNEIEQNELTAELLREVPVYLRRYDYYGLAQKMPPYIIIRPRQAP